MANISTSLSQQSTDTTELYQHLDFQVYEHAAGKARWYFKTLEQLVSNNTTLTVLSNDFSDWAKEQKSEGSFAETPIENWSMLQKLQATTKFPMVAHSTTTPATLEQGFFRQYWFATPKTLQSVFEKHNFLLFPTCIVGGFRSLMEDLHQTWMLNIHGNQYNSHIHPCFWKNEKFSLAVKLIIFII